MGGFLSEFERETERKCFDTFRRCLDVERTSQIEYDEFSHEFVEKPGETEHFGGNKDIKQKVLQWQGREPAFRLFMDGSRRTYKIADIRISSQVFPMIAGQVGVAVCKRDNRHLSMCSFTLQTVLAIPDRTGRDNKTPKEFKAYQTELQKKLNEAQNRVKIDKVLLYSTAQNENYENKGIACIQDYMIECEKDTVNKLVQERILNDRVWLIKDGSLEYNRIYDKNNPFVFSRIQSNYKRVVGVSKSFNPELIKLKKKTSASGMVADLKPYQRTPAAMYQTERAEGKFAIWYVRLREARRGRGPYDGIVKVERILTSKEECENGLDTSSVDNISAWLINERNPVCYGKDDRWANHLYPMYLTETFIKNNYKGTAHLISLF